MRVLGGCERAGFWQDPAATFLTLFENGERVLAAPAGGLCVFGRSELVAFARCPLIDGVPVPVRDDGGIRPARFPASQRPLRAYWAAPPRAPGRAALRGLGVEAIAAARPQIAPAVAESVASVPPRTQFDSPRTSSCR